MNNVKQLKLNFKYWPMDKLKEILASEPYFTDNNGRDFTDYVDEIRQVFYEKEAKQLDKEFKEYEKLDNFSSDDIPF